MPDKLANSSGSSDPYLLSLWNDIAHDRAAEYDLWHSVEHVPERVWVPGFVAGTRYRSLDDIGQRYFTLYELDDATGLSSPAYQDLVDHPTPWSASMRPAFSNFLRKTGPVVAQAGVVMGQAVSLTRMVWPAGRAPLASNWQGIASVFLQTAHGLGCSRVRVQHVEAAGPQAFKNVDDAPQGDEAIVIVEAFEPLGLPALHQSMEMCIATRAARPAWQQHHSFKLLSHVRHDQVASPRKAKPRTDLMPAPPR